MKYICDICNYKTTDSGNWTKHKSTKKHLTNSNLVQPVKKVQIVKTNVPYICKICNKTFTCHSSYYRHKNYRCKNNELLQLENENLKKELFNKDKEMEIALLKEKLHFKENENEFCKKENEFHKNLSVSAGSVANKSLSAIAYVMQNYQHAKPIKTIPQEEFKRLLYESNSGKKIHKNKKITDEEAGKILTLFFKNNSLINLLATIITSFYKTKKELQSLWTTDVSRKSFIVNKECERDNQWTIDKKGINVSEIIINPLLTYVDKLTVTYIKSVHEILGKCDYSDITYITELKYSTELRTALCTDKICNELIKSIAPSFYLEKHNE